jgi:hypothetical protein
MKFKQNYQLIIKELLRNIQNQNLIINKTLKSILFKFLSYHFHFHKVKRSQNFPSSSQNHHKIDYESQSHQFKSLSITNQTDMDKNQALQAEIHNLSNQIYIFRKMKKSSINL